MLNSLLLPLGSISFADVIDSVDDELLTTGYFGIGRRFGLFLVGVNC
jgi:hypothetical protein